MFKTTIVENSGVFMGKSFAFCQWPGQYYLVLSFLMSNEKYGVLEIKRLNGKYGVTLIGFALFFIVSNCHWCKPMTFQLIRLI
jgi:hypothetical protein